MLEKKGTTAVGDRSKIVPRTEEEKRTVKKITIWVMEEEVDVSDVPQPPTQSVAKEVQRPLRKEPPNEILRTPPAEKSGKADYSMGWIVANTFLLFVVIVLIACLGFCLLGIIFFCVYAGLSFLDVTEFPELNPSEWFQKISEGWLAIGVLIVFGGALGAVGFLLDDTIE